MMGNLAGALEGTPSMMDEVDDNTPLGHVSKQLAVEHDEDGTPIGNPNTIDSVATSTMEDPVGRPEIMWILVIESHIKRIAEDQDDRILQKMAIVADKNGLGSGTLGGSIERGFRKKKKRSSQETEL